MNRQTIEEQATKILVMYGNAYNTAFNEIDPHNPDKHEDRFEAMKKVGKRSKEIQAEAKSKLIKLIDGADNE